MTHPALTLWQQSSQKHLPPRNCVRVLTQRSRCGSDVPRSTVLQVTCVRVCHDCPLKTSKEAFQKTAVWTNRAHQESSLTKKENLRRINAIEKIPKSVRHKIHTVRRDAVTETHNNQLTRQRKLRYLRSRSEVVSSTHDQDKVTDV